MTPDPINDPDALKRKILFVPCRDKAALHKWIQIFLGLDVPNAIVDPGSNSSPLDMLWEVYSKALANNDENFSRVLYYAARDSFKTLGAAILEVLSIVHLGRDVAHMAAIESQSRKSQQYVKKFLSRPLLRDFVVGDNLEITWFVRYVHQRTGESLTEKEFQSLPPAERDLCEEIRQFIRIVICSLAGANSEHVPFFCVDGETQIMVATASSYQNRKRRATTARGLFRQLAGLNPGGRSGGETAQILESPASDMKVVSLNHDTGFWEMASVVRAQRAFRPALRLKTSERELVCTDDHPVFVLGEGYKIAKDLLSGDRLVVVGKGKTERAKVAGLGRPKAPEPHVEYLPPDIVDRFDQVLLGSLLGDCGIYRVATSNPHIKEQHCLEQRDYLAWKRKELSVKLRTTDLSNPRSGYTDKEQVGFYSNNSPLLLPYLDLRTKLSGIDRLGPLGLAVWYMDDGCRGNGVRFSTECFTEEQNQLLANLLSEKFSIHVDVHSYSREDKVYFYLSGGTEAKRRLVEVCAPHVHPSMAYKFDLDGHSAVCRICGSEYWHYLRGARAALDCGSVMCRLVVNTSVTHEILEAVEEVGERWVYDFTLDKNHNYISNGFLSHNCIDEVDVVRDKRAYIESAMIPAPRDGKMPITMLTSTRKFNFGLVQKEIEAAPETGLVIRHWNLIDVTEACPPSRHKPEGSKLTVYRSSDELRVATPEQYEAMSSERQAKYAKDENVMEGCATCPLYPMCEGRLATKQTSKSPLLKPINHTINQFRTVPLATAQAQLLCKKPSTEGMIYPQLERDIHMLSAAQMAEKMTGEKYNEAFSKQDLIALMQDRRLKASGGMDFGFTHNFAAVGGFTDGYNAFAIECVSEKELDPGQKVETSNKRLKYLKASWYGDPEDPGMVEFLRKAGFKMKRWDKGPIITGIDVVRMLLRPTIGEPRLFFLKGDEGCELLFKRLSGYHWKIDTEGKIGKDPDKEDDDECDGLRYWIVNEFAPSKGSVKAPLPSQQTESEQAQHEAELDRDRAHWRYLQTKHGVEDADEVDQVNIAQGSFKFTM